MNYTGFQLDAFLTCAFQAEANAGILDESRPFYSGGWASGATATEVREYFLGHDRELARIRSEEERQRALEKARAEIARVAEEAKAQDSTRAAVELEAVREAVASEALAFGDFYRQLLDEAIAQVRAQEAERLALAEAQAQALEAERARMVLEIAEIDRQALIADDEEVMLLAAAM